MTGMQLPTTDLCALESDPNPTFVVRAGTINAKFELLYANEAFRRGGFRSAVISSKQTAVAFRLWAQSLSTPSHDEYEFAGKKWTSIMPEIDVRLKFVQTLPSIGEDNLRYGSASPPRAVRGVSDPAVGSRRPSLGFFDQPFKEYKYPTAMTLLHDIPQTDLRARWEGIQVMMEMSDIGVFECDPNGKLLYANESWYKLSSFPKESSAHSKLTFMDFLYAEDRMLLTSRWSCLAQGIPLTCEVRWLPRAATGHHAQWVSLTCVPILDKEHRLLSITGNTVDISVEKKYREAFAARTEALEQAKLLETRFTRFAQLAPIAIFVFVPGSGMQYVNDQFFNLTGQSHAPNQVTDWFELIVEADVEKVRKHWDQMLNDGTYLKDVQFRLNQTRLDQDGSHTNIWVQSSSYPQMDGNNNVTSIMGTLFDISHFKWAERVQKRMTEEALESKRQQENFIDMTSHELRNPLSAVVQCADSVIATLTSLSNHFSSKTLSGEHDSSNVRKDIEESIEALQTIVSCSQHQKRVIDDVLTLSKLDSNLILITPVPVRPVVIVSDAMKMFDVECRQMGIQLKFVADKTIEEFEWVMLDPSRLLQVLINLLTNAIKFTKDRQERNVTVKLGGSWTHPLKAWQEVDFTSDETTLPNLLDRPEWGNGEIAYLWIKVIDTGCGMTGEEQKKLFARFSQATPRTHVKYGGSGLGLFISKSLAILQGGAIGVSSEGNVGTTFAVYISVRKTKCPEGQTADQIRPLPERKVATAAMQAIKLKVLIVEDNVVNQKVLEKQLKQVGWEVFVAGNGVEALEWLKESAYWQGDRSNASNIESNSPHQTGSTRSGLDIVLMDIEMPVQDGLTCARHIRDYEARGLLSAPHPLPAEGRQASSDHSSTTTSRADTDTNTAESCKGGSNIFRLPILAVSANARMEQIEQALDAGMDDAISKPFRIHELWIKMQRIIPRLKGAEPKF
ncbi:hypothetical protein ACN47E_000778 [Coniothyrium glycines]